MKSTKTRFTTRSLLKTVTIWAILLALATAVTRWQLTKVRRREAERILYARGGVTSTASALHSLRTEGKESWSWIGVTFFNYIESVDLSINSWSRQERESVGSVVVPPVDDETIELLWTFKHLRQLNLRGSSISDAGLQSLLQLRDLEELDISGTKVTTEGLNAFRVINPQCQIINDDAWQAERSPLAENYWLRKKLGLDGKQQ